MTKYYSLISIVSQTQTLQVTKVEGQIIFYMQNVLVRDTLSPKFRILYIPKLFSLALIESTGISFEQILYTIWKNYRKITGKSHKNLQNHKKLTVIFEITKSRTLFCKCFPPQIESQTQILQMHHFFS